jgi:hypothetical protein
LARRVSGSGSAPWGEGLIGDKLVFRRPDSRGYPHPQPSSLKDWIPWQVCRSKDKPFQFWLFNDCLLYATPLPAGRYQFNRLINLTSCQVQDLYGK